MAITRELISTVNAAADSGSTTINVPSATDFTVAFCGVGDYDGHALSNPVCTLDGTPLTQHAVVHNTYAGNCGLSVESITGPTTGASVTLVWDWGGFSYRDWNAEIILIHLSGVDQSTPVASASAVHADDITGLTAADWMLGGKTSYENNASVVDDYGSQVEIARYRPQQGDTAVAEVAGAATVFDTYYGGGGATAAVTLNEATGGGEVTATTSAPFESLITKSVSRLGSFESLRPSARAVTGPFESVQSLDASPLLRFESMQLAQLAHDCNWESVTLARQTATYPIEAMQTVESLLTTEFESLAHALALPEIHYESLGPPQIISIADLALECLGNALSSYAGPIEALSTPSISRSLVYESTTRRTKLNGVAMEALQRAATIHQIEMESLGRALYAATINIESLGEQLITVLAQLYFESKSVAFVPQAFGTEALSNVVDEAMIIVESAKSARLQTVPHFEAIQRVVSGEILNSESIASLWVEYQGQTESLAYALRDALIPIEALKYILSSHTLPMEADGELVILMTPSWRIYTIDREIRVITISATND